MRRLVASAVVIMLACGGDSGGGDTGGGTAGGEATVAPLGSGTITGVVNFTGTPPANPSIDMSEEPACAEHWANAAVDPVVSVQDGKLANVFIHVTAGLPAGPYPPPATEAEIDQLGCLYSPRVIGVMVGRPLKIVNSDPLLHNVKATPTENRGFNRSQPREGMSTTVTFNKPEVMVPLECNVHGWMKGFVAVVPDPYFATTGADGTFSIGGLPPGTYTIEAWHETLGTQTAEVTIAEDGSGSVEFTYGG